MSEYDDGYIAGWNEVIEEVKIALAGVNDGELEACLRLLGRLDYMQHRN